MGHLLAKTSQMSGSVFCARTPSRQGTVSFPLRRGSDTELNPHPISCWRSRNGWWRPST